ncbi:MAG: Eco57I restriction-modification methylase domain-containing protein, partial [Planctomycetaceae bacterium]
LKDPREIRLLDPACGSMHFGLYAFDLFTAIWEEAWEIANGQNEVLKTEDTFAPFVEFASTFADKTAFLREVPRLIIQHNIHGIDIDPRAAQIANLSIWLRAQRSWHQLGTKWSDRPRILRSNIVCAEPMPGEKSLLREFTEQQFQEDERPAFAYLLERIFDQMTLAGEAGSLLRIEEEIRSAIAEAHTLAIKQSAKRQKQLFPDDTQRGMQQAELDLRGLNYEQFWQAAEQRIYDALEVYAAQAETGGVFQRRLFADDAAQGFAFIELCRKRYDVVVMNPPFGDTTESSLAYLNVAYNWRSKNLLCAFASRGRELAVSSAVGAITDATWLKKADYDDFRRFMLSKDNNLNAISDLGWGVLDGANVASCCFASTGRRSSANTTFVTTIRLVDVELDKKGDVLLQCLQSPTLVENSRKYVRDITFFERFPGQAIAYETPERLVPAFREWLPLEPNYGITRRGYTPGDTFRFFRCWWEVTIKDRGGLWWALNNGGPFAPVVGDGLLVALHEKEWKSYRPLSGFRLESEEWFGKPGLGWGKRTDFMYAYPLPVGAMFSNEGHCVFPTKREYQLPLLAYLNSSVGQSLLNLFCGQHKLAGYVSELPTPNLDDQRLQTAGGLVSETLARFAAAFSKDETFENFVAPMGPRMEPNEVARILSDLAAWYEAQLAKIDTLVAECLPIYLAGMSLDLEQRPKPTFSKNLPENCFPELVSFALGSVFGRWDIRYATGERPAPELPDPFAPLPVCPPGMLQGDDGLPLSPEAGRRLRTEGHYPLDVAWDGILVDDPEHPLDLERRVHAALAVIWNDRVDAIEQEACELLGVPSLREWFRRPAGFFADHLKRYSKSRRKAPIYWALSTPSACYTVWLYYHRFAKDTFFKVTEI